MPQCDLNLLFLDKYVLSNRSNYKVDITNASDLAESRLLEDKLIERGGKFQSSAIMLSHVAVDGRLITGQNPASSELVAEKLLQSLK